CARQAIGAGRAQLAQRARAFLKRRTRLSLPDLELADVERRGIHELELSACLLTRANHVSQRAAVFLREAEKQTAATPHVLQPRWIEVDRRLVVFELACQRFDAVVRGVVELLKPRQRGINALNRAEVAG